VCGICSCSIIANRISWHAWKTSLACSTLRLHYGTVNQWLCQQMCKCLATDGIAPSVCSPKCGRNIIQRQWKWCFWCMWYTVCSLKMTFFYSFTTEYEARGNGMHVAQHLPTCNRSFEVQLSPQYSTKSLIMKTITVQLVTITVNPDRLHGVYQQQESLNECGRIHWVQ